MATKKTTIGRTPTFAGAWINNYVNPKTGHNGYPLKKRVSHLGSEFQSLIEDNTYEPATLNQAHTEITFDTEHWEVVSNGSDAYLLQYTVENKMDEVDARLDEQDEKVEMLNGSDVVVGVLPVSGETNKIYRVPNDPTAGKYTDYGWNGTQFVPLCTYPNDVDDEPTAGSDNLVKSGGVQNELALGAVYDVSAKNPTAGPNNDGKWASLSALLSDANLNTLIPTSVRKGGMSIKFVQSSDNKYVQARCMAQNFTTDTTQWAIADEGVYIENPEFVEVHTDAEDKVLYGIKADGDFYFGAGVPKQVQEEVKAETERAEAAEATKLDKEGLDSDALGTVQTVENSEYIQVTTDSDNKILEGIKADGTKVIGLPLELQGVRQETIDSPEFIQTTVDSEKKIIEATRKDGEKMFYKVSASSIKAEYAEFNNARLGDITISDKGAGSLKDKLFDIKVWAPKKIYALDGTTLQIFKNSLAVIVNPDNYELRLENLVNIPYNSSYGVNYDYCYEYNVLSSLGEFGFTFALYDSMINKLYKATQGTTIVSVSKGSSPENMKNVLCIGDSFTSACIWVSELRRLLTSVVSVGDGNVGYSDTADSDIVADTLTNINFIGTQDTDVRMTPNEGWGGEHYKFFAGGGAGIPGDVSPFINPNTNIVDFDYYMSTGNVKGSVQDPSSTDKIDYAFIVLGTNGNYEEEYVRAIWDALLQHNPNIKVIISGCCMANPNGVKTALAYKQTYVSLSKTQLEANIFFEKMCELDEYKNHFLYVDYNTRMDVLNNMPLSVVAANIRNKEDYAKIKRGQDNVHPKKEGYFQMADAFRGAFHYWFLNSNSN